MEQISIITHNNCKILFLNAKNLNEDQICDLMYKFNDLAIQNKINHLLMDLTGTHTTPKVRDIAAECSKKATTQLGKIYPALVGLSTIQRVIANVINRDQYFASDIEDAKKWLASKQ
jgi:hypothetical protein